jgi:hypothetical protein
LPGLTRDRARRQFFSYLRFAVAILLALGIALAIRYWVLALLAGAFLLQMAVWLEGFYVVAWPDSRPRFPFGSWPRFSKKQRALVGLGIGVLLTVSVVLLLPNTFGFALGAVILVASLLEFALNLRGKGWPPQEPIDE